ncbi:MAG: hypothetical protein KBS83_00995 [Lachnospiraceae bacterium]|nr:hypothetical protein [Candidatus Equihabitans merdae]
MAINPMKLAQMKSRLDLFTSQHPRVFPFLQAAGSRITVGSVIEVKITAPDGSEMISNIKVTQDDLETVSMLKDMR